MLQSPCPLQLRRDAIRELLSVDTTTGEAGELDSLVALQRSLAALWAYCVGGAGVKGEGWLSWRVPATTRQRTRWAVRPEWQVVRSVTWGSVDRRYEMVRARSRQARYERLLPGAVGYLTTIAAARGGLSLDETLALVRRDAERYLRERGVTWEEVVAHKRVLIDSGGLAPPANAA